MTDIMKLADEYAEKADAWNRGELNPQVVDKYRAALQSAIESLAAECAQWKDDALNGANATFLRGELKKRSEERDALAVECAEHKENAMRNARIAVSIRAERDALQAKLDALQTQEPVGRFGSAYVNENGVHITTVLGPVAIPQDAKLYAAPKALEPLTDEQILEAIRNAPKMQTTYAGWVRDQRIAWGRAILAAAHGITKGTP